MEEDDKNINARKDAIVGDLVSTDMFSSVDIQLVGSAGIQKFYRQAKHAISKQFRFDKKTVVPSIPGIKEAYVGLLPATEVLSILTDDDGEIIKSIFFENVRDWQGIGAGGVNDEIRLTLESDERSRFAVMNNGITIIARRLQLTGDDFLIEDYQIVNGCQTSHVLFEVNRAKALDASVMVPVRVIATHDETLIASIIRATNKQTQVKDEQFFAISDFPKQLESYFAAFPEPRRLYYERRSRQYDGQAIESKTRIVTQTNLVRAFAAMFLGEPHSVLRSYKSVRAKLGTSIFGKNHRTEPYYVAAFALYKLEFLLRNRKVPAEFKPARFHIVYAMRLLANSSNVPQMGSQAMVKFCEPIMNTLWNQVKADDLLNRGIKAVEQAAKDTEASGVLNRDAIRTLSFTEKVEKACGYTRPGPVKSA